jgi:hypothetical protein
MLCSIELSKGLDCTGTNHVFHRLGKPEGEPAEAWLPKHGKAVGEPAGVRLPKQGKQRVSRPKRRYPTTRKLRRLCQSRASDPPSERSYIGRMNMVKNHQCEGNFLVDSGCTGAIMNSEFVFQHKLPWVKRAEPVKVTSADGTPIEGAGVKYTTPFTMRIGQLERGISGYLPIEWPTKHNPKIDWETGGLRWRSDFCKNPLLAALYVRGGAEFHQATPRG